MVILKRTSWKCLSALVLLSIIANGCGLIILSGRVPKKPLIPIDELKGRIVFTSDREIVSKDREDGADGIYIINTNGSGLKKLSPPLNEQILTPNKIWSLIEDCPIWSQDGRQILFQHGANTTELWLMNEDGTNRNVYISSAIDSTIYISSGIGWSPDGTSVVLIVNALVKKWSSSVAIIKNINTTPRIERIYIGNSYGPKWSPDGEKIMFWGFGKWKTKPGDSDHEIFIMNKDGTDLINITNNPARDATPAWSPDGEKVVFISSRNGGDNVYIMNTDGSNVVQVTQGNLSCNSPVWSPDGKYIAYCRSNVSPIFGHELWVTTADGTMERQLTKKVRFDYKWSTDQHPDWH